MKDRTRTQHGKSTKIGCFILNIELFILVAELLLDDNAQKFNQLKTPVHGSWYSTHVAHTAQDNQSSQMVQAKQVQIKTNWGADCETNAECAGSSG